MRLKQKFSLGVFLCLSLVMAMIALVRVGGIVKGHVADGMWTDFWQYCEGCVACIMASITPFRTIFVSLVTRSSHKKAKSSPKSPGKLFWRKYIKKSPEKANWTEMDAENPLPKPPAAFVTTETLGFQLSWSLVHLTWKKVYLGILRESIRIISKKMLVSQELLWVIPLSIQSIDAETIIIAIWIYWRSKTKYGWNRVDVISGYVRLGW